MFCFFHRSPTDIFPLKHLRVPNHTIVIMVSYLLGRRKIQCADNSEKKETDCFHIVLLSVIRIGAVFALIMLIYKRIF